MLELSLIQKIIVCVPPILLAVTLHEVAHGWMAKIHGDRTAEMLGRLSLNPIKHIDPVGTVVVPALMAISTGFIFGWAKPVPVSFRDLNNPKKDMAMVALAGPAANFVMMILWAIALYLVTFFANSASIIGVPLLYMSCVGVFINCILMVLNLLPLPPLDGGRILTSYLPGPLAYKFSRIEPFGLIILIGLMVTGVLSAIMMPVVQTIIAVFSALVRVDIFAVVSILLS